VAQEFEFWVAVQVGDIALLAGEQVINAKHLLAPAEQPVAKVRAEKSRAACDQGAVLEKRA